MSVNITRSNFDTLEVTLSANGLHISWAPYFVVGETGSRHYERDDNLAIATYVVNGNPVTWGDAAILPQSNHIAVTALRDDITLFFSATNISTSQSSNPSAAWLNPYRLNITNQTPTSQTSASLSCFYQQISTNAIKTVPSNTPIRWTTQNTNQFQLYNQLSGDSVVIDTSLEPFVTGLSLSATQNTYGVFTTQPLDVEFFVFSEIFNDKYSVLPVSRTAPVIFLTLNPRININVIDSSTNYIILCATQGEIDVPSNTLLRWNVFPQTNIIGLTGVLSNQPYAFDTTGTATDLKNIKLSTNDLTQIYQYYLSSYQGVVSGSFRPYDTITELSDLTVDVTRLPNVENIYRYNFHGLGINTAGVIHNIAPGQYISWGSDTNNVLSYIGSGDVPYQFNTIAIAPIIDKLYIEIPAPVVSTIPKVLTSTFYLSALNGSRFENGIFSQYAFTIEYMEWIDENIFNPKFKFQYESEDIETIYRPNTASAWYTISNTSVVPPSSVGFIQYTFNNAVCVLPYTSLNGRLTSYITHQFTGVNTVCTIGMTVSALGIGFTEYFVKDAPAKTIIFTQIPQASSFICYPEYRWINDNWETVVDRYPDRGNILQPASLLSAYGFCHTENFYLSSGVPGEIYFWSIQPINDSNQVFETFSSSKTAWIPVKSTDSTQLYSICAGVYTDVLSVDMPRFYYDTPEGIMFPNFYTTFSQPTAFNRKHIIMLGKESININPSITRIDNLQHPAPNDLFLYGSITQPNTATPFDVVIPSFTFQLSTQFWNEAVVANITPTNTTSRRVFIGVDDIGATYLGVPKNESTQIVAIPGATYTFSVKQAHPKNNDWCAGSQLITSSQIEVITAFPMTPLLYNSNRHSLTSHSITYENLVQCFTGVSGFIWTDRGNTKNITTCTPYITDYSIAGDFSILLANFYTHINTSKSDRLLFENIVNIQPEYTKYDSNITRVFGITQLVFPFDRENCEIAPQEWITHDNYNAAITKLYDNLMYLRYMSKLYDVPPTEHIGWYGTLYYANSTARTRWYTNTVNNSYAYNRPDLAIDHTFDNLQSMYVKDNIMYISNGSSICIRDKNLFGDVIAQRDYKTIGDDFSCVRSIDVDEDNRIYVLDSFDSVNSFKGSKNRVIVFSYNNILNIWELLYEWGGLGGQNAKFKFNNPNDLQIDDNNHIWVSDTNNKCVKKYTRTGSWLYTLTSDQFTDTDKPLSTVLDEDQNIYVLTTSKIVKFNVLLELVDIFNIPSNAIKIRTCQDGGFLYVVYSDRILKIQTNGIISGEFAINDFSNYTKQYRDIYHDEFRNLYVVNHNHILKYVDKLFLISTSLDIDNKLWPLEDVLVKKDEYIQDWVINRSLQRMWDNIEIFRLSLLGKFGYETFRTVTTINAFSAIQPPDDFDYCEEDWLYGYGRRLDIDFVFEYQKPVVRTFTIDEYKQQSCPKEKVYIGINELHASEVYNRNIGCLYDGLDIIREMMSDTLIEDPLDVLTPIPQEPQYQISSIPCPSPATFGTITLQRPYWASVFFGTTTYGEWSQISAYCGQVQTIFSNQNLCEPPYDLGYVTLTASTI